MIWRYINVNDNIERNNHMINFFQKNNIQYKKINAITPDKIKFNNPLDKIFISKICCLLSHIKAIKDFYKTNEYYCIICEDDLDDSLFQYHNINEIINNSPEDWEILQLSYSIKKVENRFLKKKYIYWKPRFYGSLCYAINRKGAEKELLNYKSIDYDLKYLVSDYVIYKNVNTYTYYLSLFITNLKFKSNLKNTYESLVKYNNNAIEIYKLSKIIN